MFRHLRFLVPTVSQQFSLHMKTTRRSTQISTENRKKFCILYRRSP